MNAEDDSLELTDLIQQEIANDSRRITNDEEYRKFRENSRQEFHGNGDFTKPLYEGTADCSEIP